MRRLHEVLAALPARPPGLPDAASKVPIWRQCGGPIEEVPNLVDVLVHAELVRRENVTLRLTPAGRATLTRNRTEHERPIALALIRAGLLHDQARALLDTFPLAADGTLTCRTNLARSVAPQLVGLLDRWSEFRAGVTMTISTQLVEELSAVWALLAPPSEARAAEDRRRKSIGDRAEAYSYQLERLSAAISSAIVWVAQDDDNLGYDLEDRGTSPRRRIEVKGSGGLEARFFMSDNEWRKAHESPTTYEIQFWGGIDLNRSAADEYPALRSMGFPLVLRDVPALVAAGALTAQPERWRVAAATIVSR